MATKTPTRRQPQRSFLQNLPSTLVRDKKTVLCHIREGHLYGPHPMGDVLIKGCTKLGIRVSAGSPVAILQGSHGDRPHCIYRGFCIQGCKVGAKQSTLISHVPDAIRHGAEIRDNCMVSRINMGKRGQQEKAYLDSSNMIRKGEENIWM